LLHLNYIELTTPLYCLDNIEEIRLSIQDYQHDSMLFKDEVKDLERALSTASPDQRPRILEGLEKAREGLQESEETRRFFINKLNSLMEQSSSNEQDGSSTSSKRSLTETGGFSENIDNKRKGL
jgi:hypothetical protein